MYAQIHPILWPLCEWDRLKRGGGEGVTRRQGLELQPLHDSEHSSQLGCPSPKAHVAAHIWDPWCHYHPATPHLPRPPLRHKSRGVCSYSPWHPSGKN